MNTTISFNKADKSITLGNRVALKAFLEKQLKKEGIRIECLQYVFCSDKYLLSINQQFLNHDYYTDIITFGLHDKGAPVVAEVYISMDRVKDNAKTHGVTFTNEMLRVLFHGALHLCGYKDKSKADILMMRAKEEAYLKRYTKK